MPTTLRLLAELVEGPAVRAGRGTPEPFAREALEERITDTVPRRAVTVASVRTLQRRMGLIRGAGDVGPRRGGDARSMLTC